MRQMMGDSPAPSAEPKDKPAADPNDQLMKEMMGE